MIVAATGTAGIAVFVIGMLAAWSDLAASRGLDQLATLRHVCVAVPLAVFGAEHLFAPQLMINLVPRYMPGRSFWVYFVGCALIAAAVSIAARVAVRWSGLLFGIMMFLFVAMIHLPGALATRNRILWTIAFRETLFGGAGLMLAGQAVDAWRGPSRAALVGVGRACVVVGLVVFGIEHFLFPTALPGVPLQKRMPEWIPGRVLIDYATGALLIAAASTVMARYAARAVVTLVAGWILLLVLIVYGAVLVAALAQPEIGVKVEAINYFADTLLFAGAILALASAAPDADAIPA